MALKMCLTKKSVHVRKRSLVDKVYMEYHKVSDNVFE